MAQGTVKRFMADKGYGFIAPDDGTPDVFFHQSTIEADGYRSLQDSQRVEYTVTQAPKGPPRMPLAPGRGQGAARPAEQHSADAEASVSDFYGIRPGTIPGFAEAGGGTFMSVTDLPGHTVRNMAMFMDKLRGMHQDDPLAFEVCLRHVASMIEDQRRQEGRTDPRENPAP